MLRLLSATMLGFSTTLTAAADGTGKFPIGPPPRMVYVVRVDAVTGEVTYRDYFDEPPALDGAFGPGVATESTSTQPTGGPKRASLSVFKLGTGQVFDARGNRLTREAAKARLIPGAVVLVSRTNEPVDPAFLGVVREKTPVLIFPKPGKPMPGK